MSILSFLVLFVIFWWLGLFIILPIGIKNDETSKIEGQEHGAPTNPRLIKKILLTTLCASIITIIIHFLIKEGILDLASFFRAE